MSWCCTVFNAAHGSSAANPPRPPAASPGGPPQAPPAAPLPHAGSHGACACSGSASRLTGKPPQSVMQSALGMLSSLSAPLQPLARQEGLLVRLRVPVLGCARQRSAQPCSSTAAASSEGMNGAISYPACPPARTAGWLLCAILYPA